MKKNRSVYIKKKKNKIVLFAIPWGDPEGTVLSEISETKSEIPFDFTYMWN